MNRVRLIWIMSFLLMLWLSVGFASHAQAGPCTVNLQHIEKDLNLYGNRVTVFTEPFTSSLVIGRMKMDVSYEALGRTESTDWYQIDFNGQSGWVMGGDNYQLARIGSCMWEPVTWQGEAEVPPIYPTATPLPTMTPQGYIKPLATPFIPPTDSANVPSVNCFIGFFFMTNYLLNDICPDGLETIESAQFQPFTNGVMIHREYTGEVYVLYNEDTTAGGISGRIAIPFNVAEFRDVTFVPEVSAYQPHGVFAQLWNQDVIVRTLIGTASGPLVNYKITVQKVPYVGYDAIAFTRPDSYEVILFAHRSWMVAGYLDQPPVYEIETHWADNIPTPTPVLDESLAPSLLVTEGAYQPFENGVMLWWGEEGVIALYNDGTWSHEIWQDRLLDLDLIAPDKISLPTQDHAFGKVWMQNDALRDKLGWAIGEEIGYMITISDVVDAEGEAVTYRLVQLPDGTIYRLDLSENNVWWIVEV